MSSQSWLSLAPERLPDREELQYSPRVRGASGGVSFLLERTDSKLEIHAQAELGLSFFLKRAVDYKACCLWQREAQVWSLIKYKEHNLKNDKIKMTSDFKESLGKWTDLNLNTANILDPIGVLYALRQFPINRIGDERKALLVRSGQANIVIVGAVEIQRRQVSVFQNQNRDVIKLGIKIQKDPNGPIIDVLTDARAGLWIDRESNILVEASYEFAPFGRVGIELSHKS